MSSRLLTRLHPLSPNTQTARLAIPCFSFSTQTRLVPLASQPSQSQSTAPSTPQSTAQTEAHQSHLSEAPVYFQQQQKHKFRRVKPEQAWNPNRPALNLDYNPHVPSLVAKPEPITIRSLIEFISRHGHNGILDKTRIYHVAERSIYNDYIVSILANSSREMHFLANEIYRDGRARGAAANNRKILSIEGRQRKDWIVVDLGNILVHVFNSQHIVEPAGLYRYTEAEYEAIQEQSRLLYLRNKQQRVRKRRKTRKRLLKEAENEEKNQAFLEPVIEYVGDTTAVLDPDMPPAVDSENRPIHVKSYFSQEIQLARESRPQAAQTSPTLELESSIEDEAFEEEEEEEIEGEEILDVSGLDASPPAHTHPVIENLELQFGDLKISVQQVLNPDMENEEQY